MSENFQNPSVLGTANTLELPCPGVNNAASLTGSVCNYSRVSAPAGSSAWLLPSASGTSFQPLMGSAYLYQHFSTTMLSGVFPQSHISTSAASYPSVLEWDVAGSAEVKSSMGDISVTVLDQDTAVSSMSMAVCYERTLYTNNTVSVYPSLSASLVERTPSQFPHQSQSLSLPDQEGSQVYYNPQGTLGTLLSGLQSYDSMSYTGQKGSALQTYSNSSQEMVMVLKEVQPPNNKTPASSAGIDFSMSAQPITESSYQVMNFLGMETSLPSQTSGHSLGLTQISELPTSCRSRIQRLESNPPPRLGEVPIISPAQSNLALTPTPTQEQKVKNFDQMKTGLAKPLEIYQIPVDLDQCKDLQVMNTTDTITLKQVQEKSSGAKGTSHAKRKNKKEASEPLEGEPKAKIQPKVRECLLGEAGIVRNAAVSDRCPVTTAKTNSKPHKAPSSRISKTRSHGQEKIENTRVNSKKAKEYKLPGNKVKAEEKPTIGKMKRKKNQPELCQEAFKKPRSCLDIHMLDSVQVSHALGKKSDPKPGISSSQVLASSKRPKEVKPSSAVKPRLGTTGHGKGLEKTQVKAQKPSSHAEKRSSPPQSVLPPPGKVKLVPLPFLTMERPQARPVPRRRQSVASHRPASAYPAKLGSTNAAQPTAANSSRSTTAFLSGSAKPAQSISTNPSRPCLQNPSSRPIRHPAASRPAPYKTAAGTSLQREAHPVSLNKRQSAPKRQSQFLLQDFRFQPIPWRKPNVPEPVVSKPITKEQRPEREAMKKKAQQERENAAKHTSLGKVQFFIEREKEMDISLYYGYVM